MVVVEEKNRRESTCSWLEEQEVSGRAREGEGMNGMREVTSER